MLRWSHVILAGIKYHKRIQGYIGIYSGGWEVKGMRLPSIFCRKSPSIFNLCSSGNDSSSGMTVFRLNNVSKTVGVHCPDYRLRQYTCYWLLLMQLCIEPVFKLFHSIPHMWVCKQSTKTVFNPCIHLLWQYFFLLCSHTFCIFTALFVSLFCCCYSVICCVNEQQSLSVQSNVNWLWSCCSKFS